VIQANAAALEALGAGTLSDSDAAALCERLKGSAWQRAPAAAAAPRLLSTVAACGAAPTSGAARRAAVQALRVLIALCDQPQVQWQLIMGDGLQQLGAAVAGLKDAAAGGGGGTAEGGGDNGGGTGGGPSPADVAASVLNLIASLPPPPDSWRPGAEARRGPPACPLVEAGAVDLLVAALPLAAPELLSPVAAAAAPGGAEAGGEPAAVGSAPAAGAAGASAAVPAAGANEDSLEARACAAANVLRWCVWRLLGPERWRAASHRMLEARGLPLLVQLACGGGGGSGGSGGGGGRGISVLANAILSRFAADGGHTFELWDVGAVRAFTGGLRRIAARRRGLGGGGSSSGDGGSSCGGGSSSCGGSSSGGGGGSGGGGSGSSGSSSGSSCGGRRRVAPANLPPEPEGYLDMLGIASAKGLYDLIHYSTVDAPLLSAVVATALGTGCLPLLVALLQEEATFKAGAMVLFKLAEADAGGARALAADPAAMAALARALACGDEPGGVSNAVWAAAVWSMLALKDSTAYDEEAGAIRKGAAGATSALARAFLAQGGLARLMAALRPAPGGGGGAGGIDASQQQCHVLGVLMTLLDADASVGPAAAAAGLVEALLGAESDARSGDSFLYSSKLMCLCQLLSRHPPAGAALPAGHGFTVAVVSPLAPACPQARVSGRARARPPGWPQ
jgi:hypothetical protein